MKNFFANQSRFVLCLTIFILSTLYGCAEDEEEPDYTRTDGAVKLDIDLSGSLQNPAFSEDGQQIVFTRWTKGYNRGAADLYIFNLKTKKLVKLLSDGKTNVNLPGTVWRKGKIVFSSARDPHDEIYMIPDNGKSGDEIKITSQTDYQSYEPSFSKDASWIVYESHPVDVEKEGVITKSKVDGSSEYIRLTDPQDDCRQPNWSPAGDRILYQRLVDQTWSIWIMNSDGTDKKRVTGNNESATDAVFFTAGEKLIYSSENEEIFASNIYSINIDGSDRTQITRYDGYDGAPSISPDGRYVVFESVNSDDPDETSGTSLWLIKI
jgi:TolB protein